MKFNFHDLISEPKYRNILIWSLIGLLLAFVITITLLSDGGEVEEAPAETEYNVPESVPMAIVKEQKDDIELIRQQQEAERQAENEAREAERQALLDNAAKGIAQATSGSATAGASTAGSRDDDDEMGRLFRARFAQAEQAATQQQSASATELSAEQKYRLEMYRMGLDPDTGRPLAESAAAQKPEPAYGSNGVSTSDTAGKEEEETVEPDPQKPVRRSGGVSSLKDQNKTGVTDMNGDDEFIYEDDSRPVRVMFAKDGRVRSGERVTLRLLEDILTDGVLIPANTHLFATCQIGQRCEISVASIDINGVIYNLDLEAYDNDGLKGLYFPSTKSSENAQRAVEEAGTVAQSAISGTLSGISGNAARSGITLLRSSRDPRVEVTAGYTFYLVRKQK